MNELNEKVCAVCEGLIEEGVERYICMDCDAEVCDDCYSAGNLDCPECAGILDLATSEED